jgi:hypothetical protein
MNLRKIRKKVEPLTLEKKKMNPPQYLLIIIFILILFAIGCLYIQGRLHVPACNKCGIQSVWECGVQYAYLNKSCSYFP